MGVFNSVLVDCPHCGQENEEQFKPGWMKAWKFPNDTKAIPLDVLSSLNATDIQCTRCKKLFYPRVDIKVTKRNPRVEK